MFYVEWGLIPQVRMILSTVSSVSDELSVDLSFLFSAGYLYSCKTGSLVYE